MEDPVPRVRELLISEIEPLVLQQKATLLQSFVSIRLQLLAASRLPCQNPPFAL
jgi:hypothetical protein